jgi:hypothetical protein
MAHFLSVIGAKKCGKRAIYWRPLPGSALWPPYFGIVISRSVTWDAKKKKVVGGAPND